VWSIDWLLSITDLSHYCLYTVRTNQFWTDNLRQCLMMHNQLI